MRTSVRRYVPCPLAALIKSGSQKLWKDRLLEGVQNLNFSPEINPFLIYEFTRLLLAEIESKKTPESYLMYALYDQDSVLYDRGKVLVSNAAANEHEQLRQTLKVKKNGYLETFVVNETAQNIFFDNLKVQSTSPIIVQENAYYPFGMTIAGLDYSYNNHTNRYLYNGKELIEDLNLGLYDYGARFYDPVIGRWISVDPLAIEREWLSPYNFVQNNPLNRIDPDGRLDWVANRDGEVYWDENATSQATTKTGETYLGKSGTGIDEQTGNMLVYNSDGSIDQGMMSLGEVTVSATQSDHERTMSNPVVQNMRANSKRIKSEALPFARHMVRSAIDGAGYTGAGITALGGVVVPFVPPIGAGLIGFGGSVSTIAGGASTLLYAAEGDYKSAAIEGSLTVSGSVSGRYLKNMASPSRGLINSTTDLPILQGLKNTSFDIVNIIIVPKVK
ncbi:RHS repeat-associated core domain-containing protein [Algoriphagus marincola]|uniref:RHS repeat-associated core domain-containing protein n=1 Tax=Algoriphagus marincola TaxID=264027 RepID=UPI000403F689|nr:RHS repeat-associated core domain-containing protein [Algoriphagus marincola]